MACARACFSLKYWPVVFLAALSACRKAEVRPPANEFRTAGGSLVCHSDRSFNPSDVPPYLTCLRFDAVRIGQDEKEVMDLFGDPWKTLQGADGSVTRVYSIKPSPNPPQPYWAVTFASGTVEAVQLTGTDADLPHAFSSIKLGAAEEHVLKILGGPSTRVPVQEIGGELWSYSPFPISLEFIRGRAVSIRIARAAGRARDE